MPTTSASEFRSAFLQWADRGGLPKSKRNTLLRVLKETLESGLASRDATLFVETRTLIGGEHLRLAYEAPTFSLDWKPRDAGLVVRVVMPEWRHGWAPICRDDAVKDAVSWFFHFASQYVARSSFAAVCGAIALTYDVPTSFVYGAKSEQTKFRLPDPASMWAKNIEPHLRSNRSSRHIATSRARTFRRVISRTNALDPYVHRALFHFVRAKSLNQDQYVEEAVVALDGVVTIAIQFARERLAMQSTDRFSDLEAAFKLTKEERRSFEHLYALRCRFSAHPAQSKWWDFAEIYDEDVDILFERVGQLVIRLLDAENASRVVEACPALWSDWFKQNALMVWRAVWFDEIP